MNHSPHTFDALARAYDAQFTDTPVGMALRRIVWSRLYEVFQPGQHILELGCGTGVDALHLAQRGIEVTATDASAQMIEMARAKSNRRVAVEAVDFQCLPMEQVAASLQGRRFDGVFSNFGAINCTADLPALANDLAEILAPGASLVWVIMGRRVPWEWAWYLARGQGRKAVRRYRHNGVAWRGLTIRYPPPAATIAALKPHFAVTRVSPLGCILPPSYAAHWLNRSPRALRALNRLELLAQHSAALAGWSDHYILEAARLPVANALNRPLHRPH